jgi:23S rRNA pseudouridine2604 synthase
MQEKESSVRLNKFISSTGYCFRKEADKLIEDGRVTVNGQKAEIGVRVTDTDEILIDGKPLRAEKSIVYIAFNKPVGITCTVEKRIKNNIVDFINHPEQIFPIGRLDKPSEGLIFLTNDGDIVNKILRAGNNHEKEYLVTVDKPITPAFIKKMGNGVPVLDTITEKCFVEQTGPKSFRIILTQGLNRQIRRMCLYLGYNVVRLKRIRIMNVSLGNLPVGKWRNLTPQEVAIIQQLTEDSVKTEEGSRLKNIKS